MNLLPALLPWFKAFLLTQATELPVAWFCLNHASASASRILGVAALATTLTHPLLWLAFSGSVPLNWQNIALGESGVVLVEAGVLCKGLPGVSYSQAFFVSLLMNTVSVFIGYSLNR